MGANGHSRRVCEAYLGSISLEIALVGLSSMAVAHP